MKNMRINLINEIEKTRNELIKQSKKKNINFDDLIKKYDIFLYEQYKALSQEINNNLNIRK